MAIYNREKYASFQTSNKSDNNRLSFVSSFLPSRLIESGIHNFGKLIHVAEDGFLQFKDKTGNDLFIHYNVFGKLIFATGYTSEFPFLKNLPGMKTNELPSHQNGIIPHISGLYIVGIPSAHTYEGYPQTVIINEGSEEAIKIAKLIISKNRACHSPSNKYSKL